jgi:hypothetical protein
MLVYANSLEFIGPHASNAGFRAIGAWLKEHLGYGLRPEELKSSGEHEGDREHGGAWLRIDASREMHPQLFSWTLKHPDGAVRGRQWITEIGLQLDGELAKATCVVKTDNSSVLIDAPTSVARPRVIGYLVRNVREYTDTEFVSSVPSLSIKTVGHDVYSYKALAADIERADREYPIVVVSPTYEMKYLLDIEWSVSQLIGLAQLVVVSEGYDRYEMEQSLGGRYGAWAGALNIIEVSRGRTSPASRLFREADLLAWADSHRGRAARLTAFVTAQTNVPLLRKRIRPEGVRLRSTRLKLKSSFEGAVASQEKSYNDQVEQALLMAVAANSESERLRAELSQAHATLQRIEGALEDERETTAKMRYQLSNAKPKDASVFRMGADERLDCLLKLACQGDEPRAAQCLEVITKVFGDCCTVLPEARKSAEEQASFGHGRRLLEMLVRLVTEYRGEIMKGGDNLARQVFTPKEYAATESESVLNNPTLRRRRIFMYRGTEVEMFRHLKIGVNNNERDMIRVHFYWDPEERLIVIGHCGSHLPISSR